MKKRLFMGSRDQLREKQEIHLKSIFIARRIIILNNYELVCD